MPSYGKYHDFAEQLCRGKHDFGTHGFKIALSNGTPDPTHTIHTDISEISSGGGYLQGGIPNGIVVSISETTGTVTVTSSDPGTWTATGGGITFRYAALYNESTISPLHALVAYWDNGSSVTIPAGNTLTIDFGTLFTLA